MLELIGLLDVDDVVGWGAMLEEVETTGLDDEDPWLLDELDVGFAEETLDDVTGLLLVLLLDGDCLLEVVAGLLETVEDEPRVDDTALEVLEGTWRPDEEVLPRALEVIPEEVEPDRVCEEGL